MEKGIKRYVYIAGIITVISLVPVIMAMPATRMVLDDFGYAGDTHQVWVKTHSLIEMLKQAITVSKNYYLSWQGSLVSNFFYIFNPATFQEKYYWISLFFHFSVFVFSIYRM